VSPRRAEAQVQVLPAVALLVGWYVLVAGLLVGAVVMNVYLWGRESESASTESVGLGLLIPVMVFNWLAVALPYSLRLSGKATVPVYEPSVVFAQRPDSPLGRVIVQSAAVVGVAVPGEIRLVAEANAWVTERPRMMGLRQGPRTLYVGVPLLMGLTIDQFRAVLCHELGHHAEGHTRFGALVYRGATAFRLSAQRLRALAYVSPLLGQSALLPMAVMNGYAWFYHQVAYAVLRGQELAADDAAARSVGPATTRSALGDVHGLGRAWQDFRSRFLDPCVRAGVGPDDPFAAFRTMLTDSDFRQVFSVWIKHPATISASRNDTHPSLEDRLSRLSKMPGGHTVPDRRPALELLDVGAVSGLTAAVFTSLAHPDRPLATLA
jgi:Zn-dependent protease with chaperone function